MFKKLDLLSFIKLKPLKIKSVLALLLLTSLIGCDSGSLLDLAFSPPERKPIDPSIVGVNNFFVDNRFGSVSEQYSDIKNTLGLRYVRVLFAWTDGVQPGPNSPINFSFYDDIIASAPAGIEILPVIAHVPSWFTDSNNWKGQTSRRAFVEQYLTPVVQRYGKNGKVGGFEVWNEPDFTVVPADSVLDLESKPENYIEMANAANQVIRNFAPGKLIVGTATRSIQQSFPTSLNYNKKLKELGLENIIDVWAVHYYGTNFESIVTSNGVADFLKSLSKPVWVTESGEQGPNNQLAYVERTWSYLKDKIPGIQRFYYYEYASDQPIDVNYGLKTLDSSFPVSDLYLHLKQRAGH